MYLFICSQKTLFSLPSSFFVFSPIKLQVIDTLFVVRNKVFRYNGYMHELPITQHIIELAEKHCRENGGSRVINVNLVVGDYSGYVGESVQMYFDVISEGTLCQGAACNIRHVEPKTRCSKCGKLFKRQLLSFECPYCGGQGEPTDIGKEFYIDTIEIE